MEKKISYPEISHLDNKNNFSYFEDEKKIERQLKEFRETSSSYCFAFSNTYLPYKLNYRVPFFRILHIAKGDIKITLDKNTFHLVEGAFIIANSNTHITYRAATENTKVITMCFKWSFFSQHLIDSFSESPLFLNFIKTNLDSDYHKSNFLFFDTPNSEKAFFLIDTLLQNITADYYKNVTSEAAFLLLLFYLEENKEPYLNIKNSTVHANLLVGDIVDYINTHYQDISLDKLANIYHLHPNYLSYIIKEETGLLFSEHLMSARMKKATEFLINTNMPISAISELIGYADKSYFFKLFKKNYNLSPRGYRKKFNTQI